MFCGKTPLDKEGSLGCKEAVISMKIVHAQPRAKSELVERVARPEIIPPPKPRKSRREFIDESFLQGPVDFRRLTPGMLPQSPVGNEDDISVPISAIVGKRVQLIKTPTAEDRKDLDELQTMLEQMTQKKPRQRRKFHLAERFQPQREHRFSPEDAYAEARIHEANRTILLESSGVQYKTRQFPFDLFLYSMGGPTARIAKSKLRQQPPSAAHTFNEREHEATDFLQ